MKSLKNLLPSLGLVLGATMAMAMNFADNPTERYAFGYDEDLEMNVWFDLTGETPGSLTYQCNSDPSACSRSEPNPSASIIETGIFVKNGDLEVVD
jgi:hypothetical protein